MIGRLRGTLLDVQEGLVTLDVAGVGYEVSVSESHAFAIGREGDAVHLWVRQIVREDALLLFGFPDATARRVFDLLLRVNGCGPRVALAILGQVGIEDTVRAIAGDDAKRLMLATGVGKRLGERIILELKPVIEAEALALAIAPGGPSDAPKGAGDRDLVDALVALGYKASEAERVAGEIGHEGDLDRRIVAALQRLKR